MKTAPSREAVPAARPAAPVLAPMARPGMGSSTSFGAHLLEQQRTIGNRAVVSRLGPGVVARAPAAGAPPQLAGLVQKERQGLQEQTDVETITVPADKTVINVALTPEFPATVDTKLRAPLTNTLDRLLLGSLSTANTTVALEIDLTAHGGTKSVWRFTHLETTVKAKTTTRYLIEPVTEQAQATAGDTKFKSHGFSIAATTDTTFRPAVLRAVEIIPDALLSVVDGATFKREPASSADAKAGGHYEAEPHTVVIFDIGMKTGQSRFDDAPAGQAPVDGRVRRIVHEIGHAIDEASMRKGFADRRSARAVLEKDWGSYVTFDKKTGDMSFDKAGMPLADVKKFDAALKKFRDADTALTTARSETGHGIVGATPALRTAFKKALDADGSRPLTPYAEDKQKAWKGEKDPALKTGREADYIQEAYAEAFSLFITEPETLRALRPNTFKFFQDKVTALEKAAAAKAKKP